MKERPILFSGPMVRAILDGRKTQTRRVVKPRNMRGDDLWTWAPMRRVQDSSVYEHAEQDGEYGVCVTTRSIDCPYGRPGDLLWVREAFARMAWLEDPGQVPHREVDGEFIVYREQFPELELLDGDGFFTGRSPWKPSIHMPRWASRITLEVVSVRVERLCSISGVDAVAEGYECDVPGGHHGAYARARRAFLSGEWASPLRDANPYVWVVEFRRVEK